MVDIKKPELVGGTISVVNVPVAMLTASNMPMRDYFAAKASEEDIKHWTPMGFTVPVVRQRGDGKVVQHEPGMYSREQARYRFADAMLAAREQK